MSASWGFDPQTVSGGEIVRECMPERMSLRLDESANGEKTKAMVLAIGVFARASTCVSMEGQVRSFGGSARIAQPMEGAAAVGQADFEIAEGLSARYPVAFSGSV